MNWINGLHLMGIAVMGVSALGIAIALGHLIGADVEGRPINQKRAYPTIAVLVVSLLAGAFMAGATA